MSRPLRIDFPGALYHVTSRGDRREDIFFDDTDRAALLNVVAQGMARFDAQVLAYCLMGNHYYLVLHTRSPVGWSEPANSNVCANMKAERRANAIPVC